MTDPTELVAVNEERRRAAYEAVYAAGWLTDNAWTNGHIWRSVQAALDAYESVQPRPVLVNPERMWDQWNVYGYRSDGPEHDAFMSGWGSVNDDRG